MQHVYRPGAEASHKSLKNNGCHIVACNKFVVVTIRRLKFKFEYVIVVRTFDYISGGGAGLSLVLSAAGLFWACKCTEYVYLVHANHLS